MGLKIKTQILKGDADSFNVGTSLQEPKRLTFHDPASIALPRMHSAAEEDVGSASW